MRLKIFVVLLLFGVCFANEVIVKDPARPQGFYIVGPDISTDSTAMVYLYYSNDDCYTLTVRDTLNWMPRPYENFAADATEDILYLITRGYQLYISYNGGGAWELQSSDPHTGPKLRSGENAGYLYNAVSSVSMNYGIDWEYKLTSGWFGDYCPSGDIGFDLGRGYLTNDSGILFYSDSYFDSAYAIFDFGSIVSIFRGTLPGEIYARQGLTIYYSSDYGESFIETGVHPIDGGLEFVAGDVSGEIFAAGVYINLIMGEVKGGHIEIWRSTDYGATWDFIRDHHAAIEEHQNITCTSESFYTQTGSMVTSDENIMLFDIQGKLLKQAKCINLSNYQNGLYIISNGKKSSKVLNVD